MKNSREELFPIFCEMSPIRISVEITEKCNFSCKFCYNTLKPRYSNCIFEILDVLEKEEILQLQITGGEPTLHPQFYDILSYAIGKFPIVLIQTNGYYIDDKMADFFHDIGIAGINISIHGIGNVHDSLTSISGSYSQVIKSVSRIVERNVPLWVNSTITSENYDKIPDLWNELYNLGVKDFTLTRFTPTGVGRDNYALKLTKEQLISCLYNAKEFIYKKPGTSILMANTVPRCILPEELAEFSIGCSHGSTRFYVDIEGNLMPCGMLRFKMGNILKKSLKEIKYNSNEFHAIATGAVLPANCNACDFFEQCHGGCRASAYAKSSCLSDCDCLLDI